MERIFVVDDDPGICRAVERVLVQAGYEVRHGGDSGTLYRIAAEWQPDVVILDVMLGRENGREIARIFRAMYDTPILMLTGQIEVGDRISGLESGADDYLCKPFDNGELLARVRALIRRHARGKRGAGDSGAPLVLDRERRVISSPNGARETLTELQTNIMIVLMDRVGHVVSREELYSLVFRRPWVPGDRSLDVHMSNLRKLIATVEPRRAAIQSIRNIGYRLVLDQDDVVTESARSVS